jgi:hypothetical protein
MQYMSSYPPYLEAISIHNLRTGHVVVNLYPSPNIIIKSEKKYFTNPEFSCFQSENMGCEKL